MISNYSRVIRRAFLFAVTPILLLLGVTAVAAEGPAVRQAYACNYINGADRDDLMEARDDLVDRMKKLGVEGNSYLWTPLVGTVDLDFLWFDVSPSLDAWAADSEKFIGSPEGEANEAQFGEIVECSSSMSWSRQIYQGKGQVGGNPPVVISSSSCKLKHGQAMADVEDLITHINGVLPQTGAHDDFVGYMNIPFQSQADVDLRFMGVYNSLSEWSAGVSALQSTEAGQMLGRHFNRVMDCKSSMWLGERIIGQ